MHVLEQKIDAVRRHARRLQWVYGVSSVVSLVLATVLTISLVDFLVKFEDHGVRLIFSLTVLGVLIWAAYRFLWSNLRQRLRDVAIAQRVERQFPQLEDRLSTSVEFLKQGEDDLYSGSAALRRTVVTTTMAAAEPLDFLTALERRPMYKALRIVALLCVPVLVFAAIHPVAAGVAIVRLLRPLGNDAWPRTTNLQIVGDAPTRIASGQTFELNVRDRDGRLPDQAQLHLRFDSLDGESWGEERSEPMQQLNDMFVARQDNVMRPFFYRVTGGDDYSMEWTRLEVVEPPRIQSLKIVLQPPAYTGWPAVTSERQIQALKGTRVGVAATVTKKLRSAELIQEGAAAIPAKLGADGLSFAIAAEADPAIVVEKSGTYWLRLVDEEGLEGGAQDRWQVRMVPDGPPTVAIEQPVSNQFVTPEAEVRLRLLAKDDIALQNVTLHVSRSSEANVNDLQLPLFAGPTVARAELGQNLAVPQRGNVESIEHTWQLAPLKLKPGAQLTFYAAASDYLPQTAKSAERRITVITPQELEEHIAQRHAMILGELARVLKLQQETRGQVGDLQIQMQKVGKLTKQDVDHAQGAELNQRVVAGTLTSDDRGIPSMIDELLQELKTNRLDSPDVERRMRVMQQELARLGAENLKPIERDLLATIKNSQVALSRPTEASEETRASSASIGKTLQSVVTNQDAVVHSLESMLGELSQWDSYRRFGREIAQFKEEQQAIEEQTAEVGARTLGKDRKNLGPQELADLNKLSERQRELARKFDKIQQNMSEMARSLEESEPLPAATLGDAARQAAERGISGQMRRSSQQLEDNQVGQSRQQQQLVRRELNELLDILSNRREQELSRLVQKLREAEKELERLRNQQDGLRKQIADANQQEDPQERRRQLERLSRQQKQVQEEVARFARQLERLQAEKAARKTQTASSSMDKGGQAGQQGDGNEAGEQAEQAQKDLDEAQQELAARRWQAEVDLAQEQLAKMQDLMKSLGEQQQSLLAETRRLEALRKEQGRFSRAQLMSVRDLARAQRALENESRGLAEKVSTAEVFQLALENIVGEMEQAAVEVERQQTGQAAQAPQERAISCVQQLLEAMRAASQQAGKGNSSGGGGGGSQQAGAQDAIRALAEVKLLKLMQEDLSDRFQDLVERGGLPEDYDRLSVEQGKLADLMQNFARPETEDPEENPDTLPDLRLEDAP